VSADLRVLYCDNHVLAVDKPAGLPTVADASGDASLHELAREWVRREFAKPGHAFLGVVHRLDRPVSGVVLFARTSKAAARLAARLREHELAKVYLGVSADGPREEGGRLEQWLVKDAARNRACVVTAEREGAKLAVTRWRVLVREGGRTLLELVPETGRAHQLRVACASLGAPLLGDVKYGAAAPLADKSIALHAWKLEVAHPTRGETLAVSAATPGSPWWRFTSGP
jgi:23S rRNA pseudouridine1911/1915/1917 synthase